MSTIEQNIETALAVIQSDINYIKRDLTEVKDKLEADYVTRSEFEPVKKIVFGLVTMVLAGVTGALITLVLRNK